MDITSLICTMIFLGGIFGYDFFKKYHRMKYLFQKIGWIVEKDSYNMCYSELVRLRDHDLLSYIIKEQSNLKLTKELCIDYSNEVEKTEAEKLLYSFRYDVIKSYFTDLFTTNKTIYKLDSLEYYILSLYDYLNKPIEKGHIEFDKTYYKMYLITRKFCENNKKISVTGGISSKQIEKIILQHLS